MRNNRIYYNSASAYWPGRTDAYWRHAEEIAQEIVFSPERDLDDICPGDPVRLLRLKVAPGRGVVYYMTIEVTGKNGIKLYYVKVNRYPGSTPYEIVSFDDVADPRFLPEIGRKSRDSDVTNVSDEKASGPKEEKKPAALSDGKSSSIIIRSGKTSDEKASNVSDDNEGSIELRHETREQIRSESPTLSYAKEKMTFIGEAAKRQKL